MIRAGLFKEELGGGKGMTDDLLQGGNAGKWSYRYGDPRDRFALTLGPRDPYVVRRDSAPGTPGSPRSDQAWQISAISGHEWDA